MREQRSEMDALSAHDFLNSNAVFPVKDSCAHLVHLEISSRFFVRTTYAEDDSRAFAGFANLAVCKWGVLLFLRTFSQRLGVLRQETGAKSRILIGISLAR